MGMELNGSESIKRPDNSRLFYSAIASGKYEMFSRADSTILDAPGIYCIFNSESNMLYIGCSVNIKNRIRVHKGHLSSGVHVCRLMSDDYERSPESFQFFPITYVDESNFTLAESIRNHLFALEMQHMKRVPLAVLYNGLMPASLSEKLLLSEQPKRPQGVPITEIINRLGMSVDSIKTNGFTPSDILPHEKAIEFLQKRTVANGRFPEEKAALARIFLAELQALSQPVSDGVDSLLIRGGLMDYFDAAVDARLARPTPKEPTNWHSVFFRVNCAAVVILHAILVWYDCSLLWGDAGLISGGMCLAVTCSGLILMMRGGNMSVSENMLWFLWFIESLAIFVHYPSFWHSSTVAYSLGFREFDTWVLSGIMCICSMAATYFYRQTAISK